MATIFKRTWATINLDNLAHNIEELTNHSGKDAMAVIKANAYGHGDTAIAKELELLGIREFAVSNILEAMHLVNNGIKSDILIFGNIPDTHMGMLSHPNLIQAINSIDDAITLSEFAAANDMQIRAHIKLDTGMGRVGLYGNAAALCDDVMKILTLDGLKLEGIFTHLAAADSEDPADISYTHSQIKLFDDTIALLGANRINFRRVHISNSAGAIYYRDECRTNLDRLGIAIYGHKPDCSHDINLHLKPVMELKSTVCTVKPMPKGGSIGYGRTYTAEKDIIVATVPIGYADGYPRLLSGVGEVLIRGHRAPILGRVCMDQIMVDVTHIDDIATGDIVTLFGYDGDEYISLDEIASKCGTINYEILCGIGLRVPRVIYKNGEVKGIIEYL